MTTVYTLSTFSRNVDPLYCSIHEKICDTNSNQFPFSAIAIIDLCSTSAAPLTLDPTKKYVLNFFSRPDCNTVVHQSNITFSPRPTSTSLSVKFTLKEQPGRKTSKSRLTCVEITRRYSTQR